MASDNDLLIFGYACKVYHDDEKALHVENALIPWMGDETITIDRYDGRGHLNSLKEFESKNGLGSQSPTNDDVEEKLAETERWRSLTDEEAHEEILKRAAAPVETHFSEIGFNYEENKAETFEDKVGVENRPQDFEDPDEKPYKVPKGLTIPVTVPRPDTRREHIIIQKTASFIARQGAQLEVVIKAKQKDNPQFAFMDIEHRLNLYYRFLVQQIKSGSYRPVETEENSDSDSDSSDDYLHPSLFAKSSTKSCGPPDELKNLFKSSKNKANCAYSQLISRIRPNVEEQQDSSQEDENPLGSLKELVVVMPPPPDVQPIVDKMAEYVAKNGKDFEDSIRAKGDPKFDFVRVDHEFYEYYQYKLNEFRRSVNDSVSAEVAPNTEAKTETTEVKPKSPNALERIALDNSYHNSSIETTPRIRRIEKKKLKINIKTQDKTSLSTERPLTGHSLIGPLLPSLYDDEDEVLVQDEVKKEEVTSNGGLSDKEETKTKDEPQRTTEAIEIHASNSDESKNESSEIVGWSEDTKHPSLEPCSRISRVEKPKCLPEENSNSGDPCEDPLKKKQLERKQKLAAFLSTLRTKNKSNSVDTEKTHAAEEPRPPSSSSSSVSAQPDLKSTIRNLKKAVVESDDERDARRIEASRKYSNDDRYEHKRRSPVGSDRRHWKHKRRDRSRSRNSSDTDEEDRRRRRREKKRRRSSSGSRDSSAEGRSRNNYSSRKHHKSRSSRNRRD